MSQCHDALLAYHVPPSVQEVFCTLYGQMPLTGRQLRESTGMPRRTVYEALKRLQQLGLLKMRTSLKDSRQTYFWIASDELAAATSAGQPA